MTNKSLRDPKRQPTHPGAILREDVLPALKMKQKEFSGGIGVSRLTVSEMLNEKRSISPDVSMRLSKALGNGPEIWLRTQQTLDLWVLSQQGRY
jgi:antitoxin HigA-1